MCRSGPGPVQGRPAPLLERMSAVTGVPVPTPGSCCTSATPPSSECGSYGWGPRSALGGFLRPQHAARSMPLPNQPTPQLARPLWRQDLAGWHLRVVRPIKQAIVALGQGSVGLRCSGKGSLGRLGLDLDTAHQPSTQTHILQRGASKFLIRPTRGIQTRTGHQRSWCHG